MKIDVAIQSYMKPESLIYTLFSLKKFCGDLVDTVYINDDCSGEETTRFYEDSRLHEALAPIKIKVRTNTVASKYSSTLMTRPLFRKKTLKAKCQLLAQNLIHHNGMRMMRWFKEENDIRYQWAINETDKEFLFIIHDDIKFFDNIVALYLTYMSQNPNLAIVGDLGGSQRCPYGPCFGEGRCNPSKIMAGEYPCANWPHMGYGSLLHKLLGRALYRCRINEWCCMLRVDVARRLVRERGICFGNYENGGDVACYWFDAIVKEGYDFMDPLPKKEDRIRYYLHWWQGHEGHRVWVDAGNGLATYQADYVKQCILDEYGYQM